jgi:hypothetical protein
MTSRERVHAALEGREVDRFPVTSLYHFLYRMACRSGAGTSGSAPPRNGTWSCSR